MKSFFKDYAELCKENGKFYKKHWLGMTIMSVTCGVATFLVNGGAEMIKDYVDEKREQKKLKESMSSEEET